MIYPVIPQAERVKRLAPPKGKVRVIIDTDTFNEVDDQFALAYALMSPEKLQVEAVYAAPFSSLFFDNLLPRDDVKAPMTNKIEEGLEQSYQEIIKIYGLLNIPSEGKVFRGSKSYMKRAGEPVESDAAKDLVNRAINSEDLLYVLAIGEPTNIASAILMEPKIINKIVIVWLAGQPLNWPHTLEFNLGQDVLASQVILDSGVPLVLIPCMTAASHLSTTTPELQAELMGKSKIGSYLAETVISQLKPKEAKNMLSLFRLTYLREVDDYGDDWNEIPFGEMAGSRIIWDISVIGYMINPLWCPSRLFTAPWLTDDVRWKQDAQRHLIRVCQFTYRDGIFGDMFSKLKKAP